MDGCFENGITAGDEVRARPMRQDIGLDTNPDKLAAICKTVMLGTDATSATVSRQTGTHALIIAAADRKSTEPSPEGTARK
jgi:hypothetical protein